MSLTHLSLGNKFSFMSERRKPQKSDVGEAEVVISSSSSSSFHVALLSSFFSSDNQ
jgi:hypothetical protein